MCRRSLFILSLVGCLPASAQPLRLSVADAVQRALRQGTQAQLARSAEERARIAREEALEALLPQADARLIRRGGCTRIGAGRIHCGAGRSAELERVGGHCRCCDH